MAMDSMSNQSSHELVTGDFADLKSLIKRTDSTVLEQNGHVLKGQWRKGVIVVVEETSFPISHLFHYLPHQGVTKKQELLT